MSGNQESNIGQQPAQIANQGSGTKKRKSYPTQERVRELFDYDPYTGELTWRFDHGLSGTSGDVPRKLKSQETSSIVCIDNVYYEVCIVIWLWYYGICPDKDVRHKDFNSLNNAIDNLYLRGENIPLTQERVRLLLDYEPLTGVVTRKLTTHYNSKAGSVVSGVNKVGYITLSIDGKTYLLHRLIWLWVYGYLPENVVDHVDRCKINNKINNLREVAQACNAKNSCLSRKNTSGVKGVSWDKSKNAFCVSITITVRGVKNHFFIGRKKDFTEAVAHRLAVEDCLGWPGCDSDSSAYRYMKNYLQELKCQES